MRGIFYRSDTRHPSDIFVNGFSKRDGTVPDPKVRFVAGLDKAPDIEPSSAVCFTRHFEAAPLFPVSNLNTNSWVYVIDVDVDGIYNTQMVQYEYTSDNKLNSDASALWPMFGQERAINRVDQTDIVGAVEVKRRFNANNVFSGGSFKPKMYLPNPQYDGLDSTATLVQGEMNKLVRAGQYLNMPTVAQGTVQSTKSS